MGSTKPRGPYSDRQVQARESAHAPCIPEAKNRHTCRQVARYPDDSETDGMVHPGRRMKQMYGVCRYANSAAGSRAAAAPPSGTDLVKYAKYDVNPGPVDCNSQIVP